MGSRIRHFGIIDAATQCINLRVQRFQLLQNLFDHLHFLPCMELQIRVKTSFNSVRGTT